MASLTFVERRAVDDRPAAPAVGLIEDDVIEQVLLGEHHPRVIAAPRDGKRPVRALAELLDLRAPQIATQAVDQRLLVRLGGEVRDRRIGIDDDQVRAETLEGICCERLREAAFERDHERLVVLVAVAIDHHDDLPEVGQHEERVTEDQLRILQRDLRRQERLWYAAVCIHREQAERTTEVGDEVEPAVRELGLEEKPGRQQRLDPIGCPALEGYALGDHDGTLTARGPISGVLPAVQEASASTSASARISERVCRGVIASLSTRSSSREGRGCASARSNASGKSSDRSTTSP